VFGPGGMDARGERAYPVAAAGDGGAAVEDEQRIPAPAPEASNELFTETRAGEGNGWEEGAVLTAGRCRAARRGRSRGRGGSRRRGRRRGPARPLQKKRRDGKRVREAVRKWGSRGGGGDEVTERGGGRRG
jgi:hypothetical protein